MQFSDLFSWRSSYIIFAMVYHKTILWVFFLHSARNQYIENRGVKRLFQSASIAWRLLIQIEVNKGNHAYVAVDKFSCERMMIALVRFVYVENEKSAIAIFGRGYFMEFRRYRYLVLLLNYGVNFITETRVCAFCIKY